MRRRLFLVAAVLGLLLSSSPAASAAEAPVRELEFTLHADGFRVTLKSESSAEKVVLTLYRRGQVAYYETDADVTEDSVKAHFGTLGELDYTFTPAAGEGPKCEGGNGTREGTFRGTFDFTGENHYVTIEAASARGSFEPSPTAGCKEPSRPRPAPTRARPARSEGGGEGDVTLQAATPGKRRVDYLLAYALPTRKGPRLFLDGFRAEKREGMLVERGAQVAAPRSALRWDRATGIARLTPPAPFSGSAELRRRPHGRPIWRGLLRVPVLGGKPIRLTGPRFKASIGAGSILESD